MKKSLICLSVAEKTLSEAVKTINENKKYIDCAELRADFLVPQELVKANKFPKMAGIPVIFTLRKSADGGQFVGTETDRISFIRKALPGRYSYIDLEEGIVAPGLDAEAETAGSRIIRSFHDFNGVPSDLAQRIRALPRSSREIPKAAVMPVSTSDLMRLILAVREMPQSDKIVLGMGAVGFPTRVLATILGSFLSYVSANGRLAAPGHVDPETMNTLYGFRSISESTSVCGIIGSPLAGSRSPLIHNRGFRMLGIDAVYLPFPTDNLGDFFEIARLIRMKGVSVTIPYKEEVIRFAREVDRSVREAGACNTLVCRNGEFFGYNTDIDGFLAPLLGRFSGKLPAGTRATVVGAGGAGKACVYGLAREGAKVLIVNRTEEKARELAARYGCEWSGLGEGCDRKIAAYSDVIVQTTSAGMEPNEGEDPLSFYKFKGTEVVFDIVYKPPVTAFLSRAQKAGCRVIMGKEMLRDQAYIQFKHFTGREFPQELKDDPSLV